MNDHVLASPGIGACFSCGCARYRTQGPAEHGPHQTRAERMFREGKARAGAMGWLTTTNPFKGLLLGRKFGEAFTITSPGGDRIRIVFSAMKGSQIRLAIDAPNNFGILRDELEDHASADRHRAEPDPDAADDGSRYGDGGVD